MAAACKRGSNASKRTTRHPPALDPSASDNHTTRRSKRIAEWRREEELNAIEDISEERNVEETEENQEEEERNEEVREGNEGQVILLADEIEQNQVLDAAGNDEQEPICGTQDELDELKTQYATFKSELARKVHEVSLLNRHISVLEQANDSLKDKVNRQGHVIETLRRRSRARSNEDNIGGFLSAENREVRRGELGKN